MDVRDSPLEPLGFQQITTLSSSTALTVPAGARSCLIKCQTQAVRFRDDGTAPTATVGYPLDTTDEFFYSGKLSKLRFIEATASASLCISYYR